ncbi:MAG: hypothetical protein AAFY73_15210 [Pseudomonadota bacterium]
MTELDPKAGMWLRTAFFHLREHDCLIDHYEEFHGCLMSLERGIAENIGEVSIGELQADCIVALDEMRHALVSMPVEDKGKVERQ